MNCNCNMYMPERCCMNNCPFAFGPYPNSTRNSEDFCSFFSDQKQHVDDGEDVAFNTDKAFSHGISLNENGTLITFCHSGIYDIKFGVNPEGLSHASTAQLFLNGCPVEGTNILLDVLNSMQQIAVIKAIPEKSVVELRVTSGKVNLNSRSVNAFFDAVMIRDFCMDNNK